MRQGDFFHHPSHGYLKFLGQHEGRLMFATFYRNSKGVQAGKDEAALDPEAFKKALKKGKIRRVLSPA